MIKTTLIRWLSIALAVAAGFFPNVARADTNLAICDGGVPFVDFDYYQGGRLTIGCVSSAATSNYYGFTASGVCGDANVPLDILKIWKATADEALLSGKQIHVYWSACEDGAKRIQAISLQR